PSGGGGDVQSVNGELPDENGNVEIIIPEGYTSTNFDNDFDEKTAADLSFVPLTPENWTTDPDNARDALEELAARETDISGKADKITGGTNGNLVERNADGNIV